MSHPPTEYFGPHAKRWTDPDTGTTLSLSPRDYYREVAKEQLQREKEVEARIREAESAAWDDEALDDRTTDTGIAAADEDWKAVTNGEGTVYDRSWPNVISMDTMYDRDLSAGARFFKDEGVLMVPISGWNQPAHQRYELEVESSPVIVPPELAGRYDAIVYGATRGGIKYPTPEEAVAAAQAAAETARAAARSAEESRDKALADAGYTEDEQGRMLVAGILERKAARDANLSNDGSVSSSMPAAPAQPRKRPAARHIRKWRISPRNLVRLGLVYIIAVIGVIAVAVEVL